MDADLSAASLKDKPFEANNIAQVPVVFKIGIAFFSDIVNSNVSLNSACFIAKINKAGFSHITAAHHSAGNTDVFILIIFKMLMNFCCKTILITFCDFKGIFACFAQSGQLIAANLQQFS